ncbi:MAG: hypothetical protein HYX81_04380 [Chloroflexi bacterium]|nr:hypothetical protein [Chloroflexota bacterium]MBI4267939.1 hypothetical protein [Chloroflexota bacterium]
MAQDGYGITRRTFLKGSAGATLFVLVAGSVGTLLAACAAKPTADFEVASTTPDPTNHSHKVKVLGADVDKPPAEKSITSDGATHTHAVLLKRADFQALKKGQEITVVSTSNGTTPHTHTFKIKMPVA